MAEPDATVPQVVDPERVVDLTRLLQIRGPLGVLNVLDTIIPVVNMGDVVPRSVTVQQPSFRSTDVFSNGLNTNQPINTILATTGALAEGIYDVLLALASDHDAVGATIAFEHRNAANNDNLAIWVYLVTTLGGNTVSRPDIAFAYELGDNESLRTRQVLAGGVGRSYASTIIARRRT